MESTYSDPALLAYSDARTEYTRQLCQFIVPAIFKFFTSLLDKAREDVGRESQKVLYQFQTYLKEIPDWNMEKVSNEIKRLEYEIACEYLEDLLTAVFIAHTKILTAIRVSSKKNTNVQINVPKTERFIFKVLCEVGTLYWKNTYLFRDDVKNLDKQQNYRHAEAMVADGISIAIRGLVPVKNILRECVIVNDNEQVEADTDEETNGGSAAVEVAEVATAEVAAAEVAAPAAATAPAATAPAAAAPAAAAAAAAAAAITDMQPGMAEHPVVKALLEHPVSSTESSGGAIEEAPILTIDDKNSVGFAEYDNVYDGDNSNLLFNPKDNNDLNDQSTGLLEISDEPGTALDIYETIEDDAAPASLSADDYDEL